MATLEKFVSQQFNEESINVIQSNIRKYLLQLDQLVFLKGVMIENVQINTTNTVIEHKLGLLPSGWIVVDKTASSTVWRVSWDNRFITLRASAVTRISFWIF